MPLKIYNTRTRRKATFRPPDGEVRMYVCGPTVYAPPHMGHARSYVAFDVVRRYLEFKGYRVRYVVNITDVEDTITNRARELGVPHERLVAQCSQEFFEAMRALNVKEANMYPRVSDHVEEILAVARDLVHAGKAYVANGSVYLDSGDGAAFGFLSHRDPREAFVEETSAGSRRHPLDFSVWKTRKPGGPSWDSPWGPGYPGWHVECYAMATKHLGEVDIHGGGRDLIYPHHESENVIARAHAGRDFAKVWMHSGWLTLEWEKMSKSLGNVVPIRAVFEEWPADVVRLCLAKAHYRENLEYDEDCFRQAKGELDAIRAATAHAKAIAKPGPSDRRVTQLVNRTRRTFLAAMDDDFDANTAFLAILQFSEAVRALRRISREDRDRIVAATREFGAILGVPFG